MKSHFLTPRIVGAIFCLTAVSTVRPVGAAPQLVPLPKQMKEGTGTFMFTHSTIIVAKGAAAEEAKKFADTIAPAMGFKVPVKGKAGNAKAVLFQLDPKANTGEEGYRLSVTPTGVNVVASTTAGLFYAGQTMRQLLPPAVFASSFQTGTSWEMPAVSIEDSPRFKWRGLMLDCGRHFFSVDDVKKFIDTLAVHKFNTFHWHLTEDQGWRLEIKKYPKLTEIGSVRAESPKRGAAGQGDKTPYGGFYTQAQAREVVAYAAARHITVVPEIEMPGHAAAAIAAYPELGNTDVPNYSPKVITRWGVHPYTFAPKEETFRFLEDVLTEVMAIFPSAYIHIGGDEAPKTQWEKSAFAHSVMEKNNLKDTHELQSYFITRIEKFVNSKGRKIIGWDEILEGGLAPNAAVMSWRGEAGAVAATNQGHPVVMSSNGAYYLDYGQSRNPGEPENIGGFLPLKRVYTFEPGASLKEEKRGLLLGAQGQVWTEYIFDYANAEYMAYPRATAIAETDWTPAASKNYDEFYERLKTHVLRLKAMGVNFRPLTDESKPAGSWKSGQIGETVISKEWDVSPFITKEGTVEVTFEYSNGAHRLEISWAELLKNGEVVGRDEHAGATGAANSKNVYRFKLPAFTPGAYTLRAQVRADGGNDSNGDIFIVTK